MPKVEVVESIVIRAPIRVVWDVLVDPESVNEFDQRATVVRSEGQPGAIGSWCLMEFQRTATGRPRKLRVRNVESNPPVRIVTVSRSLLAENTQTGELSEVAGGTQLRWTLRTRGTPVRRGAEALVREELIRWLSAVASLSESRAAR